MLIWSFLAIAIAATAMYIWLTGAMCWRTLLLFAVFFVGVNLVYLLGLAATSLFVNNTKPLDRQSAACRAACIGASCFLLGYGRVKTYVSGVEKLPKDGRFLMVCNHRSMFDPLVVLDKLRQYNIAFISKPENLRLPFVGRIAYGAGFLPINRENDREALRCVITAADYIKRGLCSVAIYPEGTRSKSGELLPFHAGSFKIAQRAKAPLVVASVRGTELVKKRFLLRRTNVYLDILDVVPLERVMTMSTADMADYSCALISHQLLTGEM